MGAVHAPFAGSAPRDDVLGFALPRINADAAVAEILEAARRSEGGYVCVPNASALIQSRSDAAYARAVHAARLVLPDSTIVQKARAFLHGGQAPETLYGSALMEALCAGAAHRGLRIGLHGGAPATVETLARTLKSRFPTIEIVWAESPPFAPFDPAAAAAEGLKIAGSAPALLFVGLGAPKQEKWMHAAAPHLPHTILIGVGAAFDGLAGVVPAPPAWLHRMGFGWLFRLAMEPKRLWRRYTETIPPFVAAIAAQKIALMARPRS